MGVISNNNDNNNINNKRKIKKISLLITYNRTLPNISKIVNRNWNILQVKTKFQLIFSSKPMTAFKQS